MGQIHDTGQQTKLSSVISLVKKSYPPFWRTRSVTNTPKRSGTVQKASRKRHIFASRYIK